MLLLEISGKNIIKANAGIVNEEEYIGDGYSVTFSVDEYWDSYAKVCMEISNTGENVISNWSIVFSMNGQIDEIWNAKICAQVEDVFVLQNVEYNQDIIPGEAVQLGFVVEMYEKFCMPDSFIIPTKTELVDDYRYNVDIELIESWSDGYIGNLIITNISDQPIFDWTIEIDFNTYIETIWDGIILSEMDDCYIIGNQTYNQNIQPGESISIGFKGKNIDNIYVEDEKLLEVTLAEVVDYLVDPESFCGIIPMTEDYYISPLYDLNENVTAYLVQYFDDGEGCSYIIVNNRRNSKEQYYIEFGMGDAPMISNICEAYMESTGENADKIIYLGGYDYYVKKGKDIYGLCDEEIYIIDVEELDVAQTTESQYYEYQETLSYGNVLDKEVGYTDVFSNTYTGSYSAFKKMSETSKAYNEKRGGKITNHCAPTAGINMIIYLKNHGYSHIDLKNNNWKEIFCSLYQRMGTNAENGTFDSEVSNAYEAVLNELGYWARAYLHRNVSWEDATAYLNVSAVHLLLHGSEIYGEHSVLGVGYVSFTHSTGWESKYFQIIDGWTKNNCRYVNYSLGMDHINMVEIEMGDYNP